MKKCYTLFWLLFISFQSFSQTVEADKRLVEFFGEDYVKQMQKNSPLQIEYLNYKLDNIYIIMDYPQEKNLTLPELSSLTIHEKFKKNNPGFIQGEVGTESFNYLTYDLKRDKSSSVYFKHEDKLIKFLSEEEVAKNYNKESQRD